jgi:hypothetical protein
LCLSFRNDEIGRSAAGTIQLLFRNLNAILVASARPESCPAAVAAIDQIGTPDVALAVEDVIVFVLPGGAFSGDIGAAKDQGGVGLSFTEAIAQTKP